GSWKRSPVFEAADHWAVDASGRSECRQLPQINKRRDTAAKGAEMLKDKKAVIFDLDGTLVDSMWIWKEIDIRFLGRYGLQVPDGLNDALEGFSFYETAKYFKEHF